MYFWNTFLCKTDIGFISLAVFSDEDEIDYI